MAPGDRARLLRAVRRRGRRARRGAGRAGGGRGSGHTIGNARWEAAQRPRRAAVLRGGAGAADRPADPGRRRPRRDVPRAARRGRRDRAVELPDADRRPGASPRRWRPGNTVVAQAGRAHPADRDAARRAGAGGRAARGRASRCCRARAAWSASGWSTTRRSARSCSPARPRSASGSWPAARAQIKRVTLELGGKSAEHRVRRRRPRAGGGDRALRGVRQRRAGLLRAVPDPGAAPRLRPVHGAARARRAGRRGRRPGATSDRDGAADLGGAAGAGGELRARRTRRSRSAAARRRAPASGTRRRCWRRSARPTARVHEEIFGPVVAVVAVRGRGRRDPDRQRHALRAVRVDLDPRRRAGRSGWRGRWRPATCR